MFRRYYTFDIEMRVYNYSTITGQQHDITITGSKSNSKNKVLLHQGWQKGFLTRVGVKLGVGESGRIS